MTKDQKVIVEYGPRGGYVVRERLSRSIVFRADSKSECIAEAQKQNGFAIDGDEQSYAEQTR